MIKYLSRTKRIKLKRTFTGKQYKLQVKRKLLWFSYWKEIAWTYPEIHPDYTAMKEYLLRRESDWLKEEMSKKFYGYNPLENG